MGIAFLARTRSPYRRRGYLAAWLNEWQGKCPKFCGWVEDNIEETFTFCRLPRARHKHMKSMEMLELLKREMVT